MAKYQYTGPGPHDASMIGEGLVRPGDIRDFDEDPDWGAWTPLKPVPVAQQIAAGVPKEETVTIADQKAGADLPPAVVPLAAPPAAPENGS